LTALRKEESEMLPLEVLCVLGILYCFFMYGTLKALRAKKSAHLEAAAKVEPIAKDMAAETAEQTP
jgi:hypothetical protein